MCMERFYTDKETIDLMVSDRNYFYKIVKKLKNGKYRSEYGSRIYEMGKWHDARPVNRPKNMNKTNTYYGGIHCIMDPPRSSGLFNKREGEIFVKVEVEDIVVVGVSFLYNECLVAKRMRIIEEVA